MPEMLCDASSPMAEVTDGGLMFLVGLMAKCNYLEVPGICSSTTT